MLIDLSPYAITVGGVVIVVISSLAAFVQVRRINKG
jgi:hypothetical protein